MDIKKILRWSAPEVRTSIWLIVINLFISILIWVYALIAWWKGGDSSVLQKYLSVPASIHGLCNLPWTPLTYMFTHVSPLHLLFNMLWLYWFAILLHKISSRLLLILYIGGGIAGAIGFLIATQNGSSTMCGASASVLALIAASSVLFPDEHVRFFAVGEVRLRWVAVGAIALVLFGSGLRAGSLSAHLGGIIFGVCVALLFKYLSNSRVNKSRPRKVRRNPEAILDAVKNGSVRFSDPQRLDELLDKIRLSGFASLSSTEKLELNEISRRLREQDFKK